MADIVGYTDAKQIDGTPIPTLWHDNGDGTYSAAGYVESGSTTAATIADGADVALGATSAAAIVTDTAGTVSGKLRGLVKWAFERMPASLGQKTKTASLPVVLASDQDALAVTAASLPLPSGAATAANQATANTSLTALLTGTVLAAGENHIGAIGGATAQIEVAPVVSTSPAYTAGDCVGGLLTLTSAVRVSGGTAVLQSLFLYDTSNQKAALELLVFNANPGSTTFTDNTALSINAADVGKIIRRISIAASDYVAIDSKAFVDLSPGGRVLKAASGTTLYATLVAVGTPTYAATTALLLRLGLLQD